MKRFRKLGHYVHRTILVTLALAVGGCSAPTLQDDAPPPEPTYALPPASSGVLAELAGTVAEQGEPDHSGFMLLDTSHASLLWRLALIDSATSSVDIATYLWYPDHSGRLILDRDPQGHQGEASGIRYEVGLVRLDELILAGVGQMDAEGVDSADFRVRQSGVGDVRTVGRADRQEVSLGGVGDYDGSRLETRVTRVNLGKGAAEVGGASCRERG